MKHVLVLLIFARIVISFLTEVKREQLNEKLKQRIEKYRNLEIVDGKFQKMEPKNESEKEFFAKVDNLTMQKDTNFASNEDNFIGNDLVEQENPDKVPKETYPEKVNPFQEPEPYNGPSDVPNEQPEPAGELTKD